MHFTASRSKVAKKRPTWTPKRGQLGPNLASQKGTISILRYVEVEAKKKKKIEGGAKNLSRENTLYPSS